MVWPGLSPLAEAELQESAQWYEDRRPGLGDEFLDAVLALLRRVQEHPHHFPCVRGDVRRAVVIKRFPFSIYFREVEPERVEILAILNDSRDDEVWQKRTE